MTKICMIAIMTFSSLLFSLNELPHGILVIIFSNLHDNKDYKEIEPYLSTSKKSNAVCKRAIKSIKVKALWALPDEIGKDYYNIERITVFLGPAKELKLQNFLAGFKNLNEVSLILQPINSDKYIEELTLLTNLTALRFFQPGTKQKIITFEGFKSLTNLHKLCDLTISQMNLDQESQKLLNTFSTMKKLEIHDYMPSISSIDPLGEINMLTSLESLKLYRGQIGETLHGLTNLTYLELNDNTIHHHEYINELKNLESLKEVKLINCVGLYEDKDIMQERHAMYYDENGNLKEGLTPEEEFLALGKFVEFRLLDGWKRD